MRRHLRQPLLVAALAAFPLTACSSDNGDDEFEVKLPDLVEFSGQLAKTPAAVAEGRLDCHRRNDPGHALSNAIELNGYVRVLADPTAKKQPPAAKVAVFSKAGAELGEAFSDPSKAGRISVSVPVTSDGFSGHAIISHKGYLDTRLESSRPIISGDLAGWVWMATKAEVDTRAAKLSLKAEAGKGLLTGSVHDCDLFGVSNAVVTVDGKGDATRYTEGFELSADRGWTSEAGRFAVAALPPGKALVQAWGKLKDGGPLVLLSTREVTIVADAITSVDLQPLTGKE